MTSKIVQYERGFADRVFDLFGTSGFNVSEDGRLGWYGPDSSWYANPGDWIYLDEAGNPAVSRLKPVSSPPMKPARLLALVEVLTDEAIATCAIEGISLNREAVRQAVLRRLTADFEQGADRGQTD
ncbi:MAG: DUF4172 domain-containing protein [Patescibacteria group bacterium]|nr:DUF4172 domain-containing protein [Patescibacteria group bacterium]